MYNTKSTYTSFIKGSSLLLITIYFLYSNTTLYLILNFNTKPDNNVDQQQPFVRIWPKLELKVQKIRLHRSPVLRYLELQPIDARKKTHRRRILYKYFLTRLKSSRERGGTGSREKWHFHHFSISESQPCLGRRRWHNGSSRGRRGRTFLRESARRFVVVQW